MDLISLLLRTAARRPHVLIVAAAGGTAARLAVEAAVARRGWPAANAPADADILVVAGSPGSQLAAVVERVWQQVPAPCARVAVTEPADADNKLDDAAVLLADRDHQRRTTAGAMPHDRHAQHEDGHAPAHSAHGGHHGHGAGMALPGGLPMADLGEDRDGLTLDRLHVPLGPVLPDWPSGLVVRVTLQGDVIQEAAAEVLDAAHAEASSSWAGPATARELDALARFLGVAGWADAAARSRRLRDVLLAGDPANEATAQAKALTRRVRRSRTLRWLLRGIPAGAADVAGMLEQRLAAIEAADVRPVARPSVVELAGVLVGAELAAARLIVAAADPDTERARMPEGARHG